MAVGRRGGLIARLRRWLGVGSGSDGARDRAAEAESPADRLDAARQRLKETIAPAEDEPPDLS